MASKEVSSVRVFARFRPTRSNHTELTSCDIDQTLHQIRLGDRNRFRFDGVLTSTSTQIGTFETIGSQAVVEVLKGFNATILAYGQTGSGKTHTMLGAGFGEGAAATQAAWDVSGDIAGMMPRCIQKIFNASSEDERNTATTIECSMLEIYNEEVRDLLLLPAAKKLASKKNRGYLKLRETPERGVWIEGLTKTKCNDASDVLGLIQLGSSARSTASTNMNAMSSRSHVVVTIVVTQKRMDGSTVRAKLHLVDLAGSERVGKTSAKGSTLREAQSINQSLSALGNCMRALTQGNAKHIPFRDSKLTHLLRDSLGGNSKTTMVICLASDDENKDETMSTLRFGQRAKRIQCAASMNKVGGGLSELKKAVEQLKNRVLELEKENSHLRMNQNQNTSTGETKTTSSNDNNNNNNNNTNVAELQAKESENAALKVQLASIRHTLTERDASIATLETSKKEVQNYSQTLLTQLNEAERKQTNSASMVASKDDQLVAARQAVAVEQERLSGWEAELSANRKNWNLRESKREEEMEEREHEVLEREKELSQNVEHRSKKEEELEEIYQQKSQSFNNRMNDTEERIKRRETEVEELNNQLIVEKEKNTLESERIKAREMEVEARALKISMQNNQSENETLKEMKKHLVELENYKNIQERKIESRIIQDSGEERDKKNLLSTVEKAKDRIQDLENQLLSVYYAHQQEKESSALIIEREEQMKKDEALAKEYESRGSDGWNGSQSESRNGSRNGSESSVAQKDRDEIYASPMATNGGRSGGGGSGGGGSGGGSRNGYGEGKTPPPPPPPTSHMSSPGNVSSRPLLPIQSTPSTPSSVTSATSATSSGRTPSVPMLPMATLHSPGMSDHDLAMMLYQQDKEALMEEDRRRSTGSRGGINTPGSMHSTNSNHSSHNSIHSVRASPLSTSICGSQGTKIPASPFRNMHEGQSVVLNPPPPSFHACKVKLGRIRGNHPRYLVVHGMELVVLKPSKEESPVRQRVGGIACIFKSSFSLHGVRARLDRKLMKQVDVVDPNGKTTYVFEEEKDALKFVKDVEEHLP